MSCDRRRRSRTVQNDHQHHAKKIMSGFYGVYRYDGAPIPVEWLQAMRSAMSFYGPDGGATSLDGPCGMGHLLLKVMPEDPYDQQPVRGTRGSVVSAARLDNRDELLEFF